MIKPAALSYSGPGAARNLATNREFPDRYGCISCRSCTRVPVDNMPC